LEEDYPYCIGLLQN